MVEKLNLAVLVSGNGSNLQAIIDACESGALNAQVELVVSSSETAFAIQRAKSANIPTHILAAGEMSRSEYDAELSEVVSSYDPDIVVLAGWNRLLTSVFLSGQIVINLHPALPGTFVGLGCIEKTFDAFKAGEVTVGGLMVHYVPDEGVDSGPVILSCEVDISNADTLEEYSERVHAQEHRSIVEAIAKVGAEMFPN